MTFFTIVAALVVATLTTSLFAADVGVSVSVGQPRFYGRQGIADYSQPQVIYVQPRIVEWAARYREPVYLHVPPGYARNWRNHCDEYYACGEHVYFVQNGWYNHEFFPNHHEHHADYEHEGDYYNHDHGGYHNDRHEERHHNYDPW